MIREGALHRAACAAGSLGCAQYSLLVHCCLVPACVGEHGHVMRTSSDAFRNVSLLRLLASTLVSVELPAHSAHCA